MNMPTIHQKKLRTQQSSTDLSVATRWQQIFAILMFIFLFHRIAYPTNKSDSDVTIRQSCKWWRLPMIRLGSYNDIYIVFRKTLSHVKCARGAKKCESWNKTLWWLNTVLSNWTQSLTAYENPKSGLSFVSRVPQRSLLRPVHFVMFFKESVTSKMLFYAEHAKVDHTMSHEDKSKEFQSDLKQLRSWSDLCLFQFNWSLGHKRTLKSRTNQFAKTLRLKSRNPINEQHFRWVIESQLPVAKHTLKETQKAYSIKALFKKFSFLHITNEKFKAL